MRKERKFNEARPIRIVPRWLNNPAGCCLFEMGNTKVLCTAVWQDDVPQFLKGSGQGWLTCEYRMLPASTINRISRDRSANSGRTYEIQRLIGRSLRACVDLNAIGERTIFIDVDVLQADGGTRTAGINGAVVALYQCLKEMEKRLGVPVAFSFKGIVTAISVGIVNKELLVDLNYSEDSQAEVDMNVVMFEAKDFVELQGTGERALFSRGELLDMLTFAQEAISDIYQKQKSAIETL